VVHPHGRGELHIILCTVIHNPGSSPRAWGTRSETTSRKNRRRFIPTGVGNSSASSSHQHIQEVHPHGRGELCCTQTHLFHPLGSSPRAWGTHALNGCGSGQEWFIPTGVGNSFFALIRTPAELVHPHGRGELSVYASYAPVAPGSSPRAWGTLQVLCPGLPPRWFIPTGVGNSEARVDRSSVPLVHPHGRGELGRKEKLVNLDYGSSPRAWGTRGFDGCNLS